MFIDFINFFRANRKIMFAADDPGAGGGTPPPPPKDESAEKLKALEEEYAKTKKELQAEIDKLRGQSEELRKRLMKPVGGEDNNVTVERKALNLIGVYDADRTDKK